MNLAQESPVMLVHAWAAGGDYNTDPVQKTDPVIKTDLVLKNLCAGV